MTQPLTAHEIKSLNADIWFRWAETFQKQSIEDKINKLFEEKEKIQIARATDETVPHTEFSKHPRSWIIHSAKESQNRKNRTTTLIAALVTLVALTSLYIALKGQEL